MPAAPSTATPAPPTAVVEAIEESKRANRQVEKASRRAAIAAADAERQLDAWFASIGIRVVRGAAPDE